MSEKEKKNAFEIVIKDGKIDVGDPGSNHYGPGIAEIKGLKNGAYVAEGKWVKRKGCPVCKSITLRHESLPKKLDYRWEKGQPGTEIYVDSGLAGFFPSPKPDYNDDQWEKLNEGFDFSCGNALAGGAFWPSGFGDGIYLAETLRM